MTDDELKALVASLAVSQQKTDEQIKQTHEEIKALSKQIDKNSLQIEKNSKQIEEHGTQIGGLGKKFGSFTEGLALPYMTKILTEQFGMTTINPSVRVRDKQGNTHEIDVLAYNNGEDNTAFIVEVKSHLREEAISQILKQLHNFPSLFPDLAHKKCYGIITAVDANEHLRRKVLDEGLYFAEIHDEQFALKTPDDFVPRCFGLAA
jgi:hypothetical protein